MRWSVGIALMVPLAVFGEEVETPQTPISTLLDAINVMDEPRDYLSGRFVDLVNDIDSFFGDDRNYLERNESVVQLDLAREIGYGGEHRFVLSGRAKVHLPRAEKSLHLLLETDPDKNTAIESAQNITAVPGANAAPRSYAAGVSYEKAEEERWHFGAAGGLQFRGLNTAPFARVRASYAVLMEQWRLKAAETAFWYLKTGVGESTQLDLERIISAPLLFRATSNATWLKDTHNFDLRQDFTLFHTLDERTALLYQASVIGVSQPQLQATDYVALLLYRYRLHRDWMFFELSPQFHFPRTRNFQLSPLLTMRLEVLLNAPR